MWPRPDWQRADGNGRQKNVNKLRWVTINTWLVRNQSLSDSLKSLKVISKCDQKTSWYLPGTMQRIKRADIRNVWWELSLTVPLRLYNGQPSLPCVDELTTSAWNQLVGNGVNLGLTLKKRPLGLSQTRGTHELWSSSFFFASLQDDHKTGRPSKKDSQKPLPGSQALGLSPESRTPAAPRTITVLCRTAASELLGPPKH